MSTQRLANDWRTPSLRWEGQHGITAGAAPPSLTRATGPRRRDLLDSPEFVSGNIDTGFLDGLLAKGTSKANITHKDEMKIAAIAAAIFEASGAKNGAASPVEADSDWKRTARREALRDA